MFWNLSESVRLDKAEDDWSPQTTKHSSDIIKNNEILRHIDHSYFLICNSCLWCATYFGIDNLESLCASQIHTLSCHICNHENFVPLARNLKFIDYLNAQIILIGAREGKDTLTQELEITVENERENDNSADIFTRLRIRKDQVPIKPLIQ